MYSTVKKWWLYDEFWSDVGKHMEVDGFKEASQQFKGRSSV
jgi:hypothetical protein